MIVVVPAIIDDSTLTLTDVPETDFTNWLIATVYAVGDVRQETTPNIHSVYECTVANTSDALNQPSVDVDPDTGIGAFWIRVSATNTWAMFSDQISDQTEQAVSIEVELTPGTVFNAIALFNLDATSVTVVVDDPVEGEVYNKTVTLVDGGGNNNWYGYYFDPIVKKRDIALTDLPPYAAATVTVTIDAPAGTAKVGLVTIGYQIIIGVTTWGSGVGLLSYNTVGKDAFGNRTVIRRGFSKTSSSRILIDTNRSDFISNLMTDLIDIPCTWIGSEVYGSTIIYGPYKDYDIILANLLNSPMTLEIEGLT